MTQFPENYKLSSLSKLLDSKRMFSTLFFYPNMCHVCHKIESDSVELRKCEGCHMISYCGKLHQAEHFPKHKDFCKQISNVLKANGTNLFDFMRTIDDPAQRLKRKQTLIEIIKKKLPRRLQEYEKMMFLYPRVCFVCLESNPGLLQNCRSCPQASFCKKHKHDPGHAELCSYYKLCYTLNWYHLSEDKCKMKPEVQAVPSLQDAFKLPENMEKFLEDFKMQIPPLWSALTMQDLWSACCSEFFTKPLTLMHVLEKLEFKSSELVVHIIGVPESEEIEFGTMEVLLHLIPQLMTLKVILISTRLFKEMRLERSEVEVCKLCAEKKKTFIKEGIRSPYSTYANSKSFITPNIVIAYDLGDDKFRLWDESISKIKKIQVPLVVTRNSASRALREQKRMTEIYGLQNNMQFKKNPFASRKPIRDVNDDELRFSNNYVAVYTLFEVKKEKQPKKKKKEKRGHSEEEFPDFVQEEERLARLQKNLAKRKEETRKSSNSMDESENSDSLVVKQEKPKDQLSKDVKMNDSRVSNSAKEEEKKCGIKKKEKGNLEKETQSRKNKSNSQRSPDRNEVAEISKEQSEAQLPDSTIQLAEVKLEENQEKPEDNSTEEETSRSKVPDLNKENEEKPHEKLSDDKKSTNENSKSEKLHKDPGQSKTQKSDEQSLNRTNGKNEKSKENKSDSSMQNTATENEEKDQSADAKKPKHKSSSKPVADKYDPVENEENGKSDSEESSVQESQEKPQDDLKEEESSGAETSTVEVSKPDEQNKSKSKEKKTHPDNKRNKAGENQGKLEKNMLASVNQNSVSEGKEKPKDQLAGSKKSGSQHSSKSAANKKEEPKNKVKEQKEENKKSKKKKPQNQTASPEKNSESSRLSSAEIPVASTFTESDRKFEETSSEEKEPIKQGDEPMDPLKLLGTVALAKRSDDLLEENKNLTLQIKKLEAELLNLKVRGKSTAKLMLEEIKVLKVSLQTLEAKLEDSNLMD